MSIPKLPKKPLTPKQQARAATKVFKILKDLGFVEEQGLTYSGASGLQFTYWWRQVPYHEIRLCIGHHVPNQCTGGVLEWCWMEAPLKEAPKFGYSGTSSSAAMWGTVERVIESTLSQFVSIGQNLRSKQEAILNQRRKQDLEKVMATLNTLSHY